MAKSRQLVKNGLYRHFKGGLYEVLYLAHDSADENRRLVVYRSWSDYRVWIRPFDEFMSEVDHIKYPDVKQKYRFELVVG